MYDSISGNTEYPLDPEFYTLNQLRHLMIDGGEGGNVQ